MATTKSKPKAHTETTVTWLPHCDVCRINQAGYDGQTVFGYWANMCQRCWSQFGTGLGLGKGQKLTLKEGATT